MRNFIICTHPQISLGKSRRMRWAGHIARMGEERKVQGFGGKAGGKETTWKTKAWVGRWGQNGF
jgi:hypothetical protein